MKRPANTEETTHLAFGIPPVAGAYPGSVIWTAHPVAARAAGLVLTPDKLGWLISHERSGRRLAHWFNCELALEALAALATVRDWRGDTKRIQGDGLNELALGIVDLSGGSR